MDRIAKVFVAAYGDECRSKELEMILSYLQDTLEQTKKAKDLLRNIKLVILQLFAQV
jgi:hypothetical protein